MKFPRNARIFRGQLDAAPFAAVFFLLRVGGRVPFGPMSLDVEVPFIGAEGVRFGLSYAF